MGEKGIRSLNGLIIFAEITWQNRNSRQNKGKTELCVHLINRHCCVNISIKLKQFKTKSYTDTDKVKYTYTDLNPEQGCTFG